MRRREFLGGVAVSALAPILPAIPALTAPAADCGKAIAATAEGSFSSFIEGLNEGAAVQDAFHEMSRQILVGLITPNQCRAIVSLPPIEGGDIRYSRHA